MNTFNLTDRGTEMMSLALAMNIDFFFHFGALSSEKKKIHTQKHTLYTQRETHTQHTDTQTHTLTQCIFTCIFDH